MKAAISIGLATLLSLGVSNAYAHITLENNQAPVGAGYKAVFRVPHGCSGAATTKIRVQIPEGVIGVKAMPKPGWTLETIKGPYSKTYQLYHAKISEGAKEVIWSGGKLLDDNYDEFVVTGFLSTDLKPNTTLYFPTVQECETGINRWIEIPADGKKADDYPHPAPGLKLLPKTP